MSSSVLINILNVATNPQIMAYLHIHICRKSTENVSVNQHLEICRKMLKDYEKSKKISKTLERHLFLLKPHSLCKRRVDSPSETEHHSEWS